MVKIIKNDPIPTLNFRSAGNHKYPWGVLEVGESFVADCKDSNSLGASRRGAEARYGRKFITRTTPKGLQVWRVK